MRVTIINGNQAGFDAKLNEIETLYGDQSQVNSPERAFIAHIPNIPGGMLFSIFPEPNHKVAQILLAVLPPEHRKKGHMRTMLDKANKYLAKKGAKIEVVELDTFDPNPAPWIRLGFTVEDNINLSPACLTKPVKELFPSVKRHDNGIPIDELAKMLGIKL